MATCQHKPVNNPKSWRIIQMLKLQRLTDQHADPVAKYLQQCLMF